MKTKVFLSFIVAIVIALVAASSVLAGTLSVNINEVSVNDVVLGSGTTLAGSAAETVPIVVKFTANSDLQDLKVKVWIEGYKSDVYASTARFDAVNGSTYIKRLSLTLPSVDDLDQNQEGLTLYVRVADKDNEVEQNYKIEMQRDTYSIDLLSVDAPSRAAAGEVIALDIVLKNIGLRDAQDTFVTAAIPELGMSKKAYFGDLYAQDNSGNNQDDARERRIYLIVPSDAKSGDYELQVKASNYDTTATVKKVISITGLAASTGADNSTAINAGKSSGKEAGIPTSIVVLTVVLVIIFVVLLVVLIVLLTKKPADKAEDFGESYY